MNQDRLHEYLEQHYMSKRGILPALPLGIDPTQFWQEVLEQRKSVSIPLPLHSPDGEPYWYVTTQNMIRSSEIIAEEYLSGSGYPQNPLPEEAFFTSFLEGSPMSLEDGLDYYFSGREPRDIEEQMITNNRNAAAYCLENLYRPVDEEFIKTAAYILTDKMDGGGHNYRTADSVPVPLMMGEPCMLPPASKVSACMEEIVGFISQPFVHPLIKAGVSQAFFLAVRPFPEGNERLGRLLSGAILQRAGYRFFGDTSFSAFVAKDGYSYFEAAANIMREENGKLESGGDLTYFLDYYIGALAGMIEDRKTNDQPGIPEKKTEDGADPGDLEGFVAISSLAEDKQGSWIGEKRFHRILSELRDYFMAESKMCLDAIEGFLDKGKMAFESSELVDITGLSPKKVSQLVVSLKKKGLIDIVARYGPRRKCIYTFSRGEEPFKPEDYSEAYIQAIEKLDDALGAVLRRSLASGYVRDNGECDMQPALQMGLVIKAADSYYLLTDRPKNQTIQIKKHTTEPTKKQTEQTKKSTTKSTTEPTTKSTTEPTKEQTTKLTTEITKEPAKEQTEQTKKSTTEPATEPAQNRLDISEKKNVTKMYESFGNGAFSLEMFVATLEYDSSTASSYLHRFQQLNILDCRNDDVYQLLVNPEQNPEYFFEGAA